MKLLFTGVLILALLSSVVAQPYDSLKVRALVDEVMQGGRTNTLRQDSLLNLAVNIASRLDRKDYLIRVLHYHSFLKQQQNELGEAIKMGSRAVDIALEDNLWRSSSACIDAIVNLSSAYYYSGKNDSCLFWVYRGKRIARNKDVFNYSILLSLEALAKSSISKPRKEVNQVYDSAVLLARQTPSLHDDIMAGFNRAIFVLNGSSDQAGQAIEILTSFAEAVKDPKIAQRPFPPYQRMIFQYRNPKNTLYSLLAIIYLSLAEKDAAASYMEQVVNDYKKTDNPYVHYPMFDLAAIEVLRGKDARAKNLYDSAVFLLKEKEGRDSISYASYYFLLGHWSEIKKDHSSALIYYRNAVRSAESFFTLFCFASYLRAIVNTNDRSHEADSLIKSVSANQFFFNQFLRVEFLKELASYYQDRGQEKLYLRTIVDHYRLKDSLSAAMRFYSIREVEMRFQNRERNKELAMQNQELEREKERTAILTVGLTSLAILLMIIFLLYGDKRKKALALQEKNEQVETLLRELHHRVKNNLQMISSLMNLQSYKVQDEFVRKALQEGQGRVDAMSLIHQKLYLRDNLRSVNIEEYFALLTTNLTQSYGFPSSVVSVRVSLDSRNMDIDLAIPVALIANELMTNAFKYAFREIGDPRLAVRLQQKERMVTLEVHDNGPGVPESVDVCLAESFGLKLVNTLAKQLKGNFDYKNQSGAYFILTFLV